jgi:hypothetical protein
MTAAGRVAGADGDHEVDLDGTWRALVTAALLGTDRRPAPIPAVGPVADLVADAVRPDDAARMLAAVAGVAAARRAAFVPGPHGPALRPPADDARPWCSPTSVSTWRTVIGEWPVLEDEWVLTVIDQGFRVPPDALVELLLRHRGDAVRRARVALAGGPSAAWLTDHLPSLAPTTGVSAAAESVAGLPELPVPPDLAELLTVDARTFTGRLVSGFESATYGQAHRAVLVNLLARCRPAVLVDAADALELTHVGLALALSDLARLRHRMLVELGVPV